MPAIPMVPVVVTVAPVLVVSTMMSVVRVVLRVSQVVTRVVVQPGTSGAVAVDCIIRRRKSDSVIERR